jgi:hypothetical protein
MIFPDLKKRATDMRHATHPGDATGTDLNTAYLSPIFAIGNPDGMIPADYLPVLLSVIHLIPHQTTF